MEFLTVLWLPIVLSAVVLFFASFIAWTVLPHHETEFQKADREDDLMRAVKDLNLSPGTYMFPHMTHKENKDPAAIERYTKGPRGKLVVWDMPNMGRNLGLTLLYFMIIAAVTAYISWSALAEQEVGFMKAFQITGAIGVLVFASSGQLNAIWFPRRSLMDLLDGIAFGVLMGLIFGFFWPSH